MKTQALILASGLGARLKPYTSTQPKQMLPVAGTPLMGHIAKTLIKSGITDIAFALYAFPEIIQRHFGSSPEYTGATFKYLTETCLRGTAYSLKHFRGTENPVLVVYGDLVLDRSFPWTKFIGDHLASKANVSILYKSVLDARTCGVIELEGPRITGLREKPFLGRPEPVAGKINAAVYLLSPNVIDEVCQVIQEMEDTANNINDYMKNVFPYLLEKGYLFHGFDLAEGYWISVDRPEHYQKVYADYLSGKLRLATASHYSDITSTADLWHAPLLSKGEHS